MDLLHFHRAALEDLITRKRGEAIPVRVILGAVLPEKIPPVALGLAGISPDARLSDLSDAEWARLMGVLAHLTAKVTGTRGFQFAQVSTGGIPVSEVDPATMASRIVPGLHFAGEVMDVIGPCGGYNLQWAWTSGAVAGAGAAG